MGRVVETVRRHAVVAGVGGALLLTGVGFGAAAVGDDTPAPREVAEVADVATPTPTETAAPSSAPAPQPVPVPEPSPEPVAPEVGDTPEASIDVVTPAQEPAPAEQPDPAPVPVPKPVVTSAPQQPVEPPAHDPMAPFTDAAGNTYLPAPDVPAKKLPGEPGYVPPPGETYVPPTE